MAQYTIPEINETGVDDALLTVATTVPIFVPFLLLFIFSIIFITGFRKQKESTGYGDAPLWGVVAGIVTSIVALLLSTKAGMISLPVLIVPIVITIMAGIWLFSSDDRQ